MNNTNNSLLVKIISVSLVFALLFSTASISTYAESTTRDFQAEIDAIQNQIDSNNSQKSDSAKTRKELQAEIDALQQQIDVYNAKIDDINVQISEKDAIIDQYEEQIAQIDAEIDVTNTQIDTLNAKIADTYEVLKQRLRASYMAGETSTLEILLGSSDYESFLTRLELLSVVAKKDDELVSGLQQDIGSLNDLNATLDAKKNEQVEKRTTVENDRAANVAARSEVEKTRQTLVSKQNTIENKVQTINGIMAGLDKESADYRVQMAAIQAAKDEYDKKFANAGNDSGGSGVLNGGGTSEIGNYPVSSKGMICPLQYSNVYVSSPYGMRSGNMHSGIDLCTRGTGSTQGKEIRAAASGTVVSAEYHSSWGNNVYIQHENGVRTRYAHCSSMIVSAGQKVQQGQVIAYVGSTGNSSGPHLHFEVWLYSSSSKSYSRVDPTSYFNIP